MESVPRGLSYGAQRRTLLVMLVVAFVLLVGCAPFPIPGDHIPVHPTRSAEMPLASQTVYWGQNTWLTALRASDGKPRWQTGHWEAGSYYGPLATTLADDTLYSLGIDAQRSAAVYATAASDGKTRWQTSVAGCLTVPVSVPLVADGVVYVALTGHFSGDIRCEPIGWVYALRASDGHVLWRVPFTADNVWPALGLTNGILVVASSPDNGYYPQTSYLSGLRASDGKQLWRMSTTKYLTNFMAADGLVIINGGANARNDSRLDVEAIQADDGTRLWESVINDARAGGLTGIVGTSAPAASTAPYLANGMVYVFGGDGYLYALSASDGHMAWQFQTGAAVIGAPAFVDGYLYVGIGPALDILNATSGGLVRSYYLFDPSASSGSTSHIWYIWSTPLVTKSAISVSVGLYDCSASSICHLIDLNGKLFAVDSATGKVLWQYQTPQGWQVTAPMLGS